MKIVTSTYLLLICAAIGTFIYDFDAIYLFCFVNLFPLKIEMFRLSQYTPI